jgi:gp16 family phage-associated protein
MHLNPDQLKNKFKREGRSFSQWAKDNGYQYQDVIRVLNGFNKGQRGRGHEIAVKLGLKEAS